MTVADWILIAAGGWIVAAAVTGLVVGKVIRNRDRQVVADNPPVDGAPTTATKEFCVHQGDPDDNANLRFLANGPEGRQRALNYAAVAGGQVSERSVILSEWRTVEREAS